MNQVDNNQKEMPSKRAAIHKAAITGTMKPVKAYITLDKDMQDAIKGFISSVWLMHKAQFEGTHPALTKEYEKAVDVQLAILVRDDEKEVPNG